MQYEVERKFAISEEESKQLPEQLIAAGFVFTEHVLTTDIFLPIDEPGEMLRLREQKSNGQTKLALTHKKWITTADGHKEREEAEEKIGNLVRHALLVLSDQIDKQKLPPASKSRDFYEGEIEGYKCLVCIDKADGLGKYSGHYTEIEFLVDNADDIAKARERVLAFAAQLLGEGRKPEPLSYMEMLKASLS